jgi:alpha-ketoglutaric semialdehyde dehydrogenase
MTVLGQLLIGSERVTTPATFLAVDAATRRALPGEFAIATAEHVARACTLADEAFEPFRAAPLDTRARFLEVCAANIGKLGDELLDRAGAETGLPRGRLEIERGRTMNQLNLFARVIRQGDWLGLRVDRAEPERKPLPRSDLRQRKIPLGPVAVFGASNFPLAFSAGGGDVASALAAGCPVVVKAHPAHPGTSVLVAGAIADAVAETGLHPGAYSHLSGPGNELGAALVGHPLIQAVGFTGSRQGGLALLALAARRPVPIPVYAEMSSINPVVILPAALKARGGALASEFIASLNMGVGQFCTNPGLVMLIDSPEAEQFVAAAGAALTSVSSAPMLTQSIQTNFDRGVARLCTTRGVTQVARGKDTGDTAVAALFSIGAADFLNDVNLQEEVFGPSSLIVRCASEAELMRVLRQLEGQLTATMHIGQADFPLAKSLLSMLERRAGRVLINGWPTGVEVAPAMVHGGPFPAASDGRTTSVGTLAIDRFLRPVCYQDLPTELLPEELRDGAPFRFRCTMDGEYRQG